jgi:hypothetical protein
LTSAIICCAKPPTVLEDHSGPEPKLAKGESITDAIERLRRRGRELKAEPHQVRAIPERARSRQDQSGGRGFGDAVRARGARRD